jgi:hypothetical protein
VLWDFLAELYWFEWCCGVFEQNYTGVIGVVGNFFRIVLQ